MVLMDRLIHGMACDCVTSDNYGGALSVMRHLIALGHKQIVFLTHHELELLTVQERYRGYRDVMLEAGLMPFEPWLVGQPGIEIGGTDAFRSIIDMSSPELQQIKKYLQQTEPCPTAIFALNDYLAILTTRTLKLLDMHVPETVSVAGFDDIDLAAHLEVPLTTVYQDMFTMGRRAAELLLDRLDGYTRRPDCDFIPTQLRIRASTAAPLPVSTERR
jgi:DNA-binding LacI/PurR family transcriptional regulator